MGGYCFLVAMKPFFLVHGSNGGGPVWQKLAPLLQAPGYVVHTPTLSSLTERSHLLACGVDLTTHITDVTNLLVTKTCLMSSWSETVTPACSSAGWPRRPPTDQTPA